MTELTPQEESAKAAVVAMRNAQSNMDKVLKRVAQLEDELRTASYALKNTLGYVGEHSHAWPISSGQPGRKVKDAIGDAIARIEKVLA